MEQEGNLSTKRSAPSFDSSSPNVSPSKRLETKCSSDTPKKHITCLNDSGIKLVFLLGSEFAFQRMLLFEGDSATCLIDDDGVRTYAFDDLLAGVTYTFGRTGIHGIPLPNSPRQEFDYTKMRLVKDVCPRPRTMQPAFVCNKDWLSDVRDYITKGLEEVDDSQANAKVAPIAFVRCSRGGKTRGLNAIANCGLGNKGPIAILCVSFNGHSGLLPEEQNDPLQALCQRIAFEASYDDGDSYTIDAAYERFRSKKYYIDPLQIVKWLGAYPAVLLVDELNLVVALTKMDSETAEPFGRFIKTHFLNMAGRFFVFTSHVITTATSCADFMDSGRQSSRKVKVYPLPLVDDLSVARRDLNEELENAIEAIFFGLIPALIYEQRLLKAENKTDTHSNKALGVGEAYASKMAKAVKGYNSTRYNGTEPKIELAEREQEFLNIVESLITGKVELVPKELHILLDAGTCGMYPTVIWIPYTLHYVLGEIRRSLSKDNGLAGKAEDLYKLLGKFKDSEMWSGENWEYLFVFQLIVRCLACLKFQDFVPSAWFEHKVTVEFNLQERCTGWLLTCKNWKELLLAIKPTPLPTIFVFHPPYPQFPVFDVIVLYWENGLLLDFWGFQLKGNKTNPRCKNVTPTEDNIKQCMPSLRNFKCIWVNGNVTKMDNKSRGWLIPSEEAINGFYGASGSLWTPQKWQSLQANS